MSPTARPDTDAPASTTLPTTSWPGTCAWRGRGARGRRRRKRATRTYAKRRRIMFTLASPPLRTIGYLTWSCQSSSILWQSEWHMPQKSTRTRTYNGAQKGVVEEPRRPRDTATDGDRLPRRARALRVCVCARATHLGGARRHRRKRNLRQRAALDQRAHGRLGLALRAPGKCEAGEGGSCGSNHTKQGGETPQNKYGQSTREKLAGARTIFG
jgi:hypothetical protein